MKRQKGRKDSVILNHLYEVVEPGETPKSFERKINKYLKVINLKYPDGVDDFALYYKGNKKFTEIAIEKKISATRVRSRVFHIILKIRNLHFKLKQEKLIMHSLQGLNES